ncbi:polysaccharide biosynthesis protein [Flavobacterium aquatile]|uniref:polysaccharide biosynthesis protein n=1 Tax=Flavobacterium aquatile TaxID=245 RepID=UPI0013F3D872|nr:nucleoside-diphosphate sugar epimerase/dehydratase [Flavobacterium aquatile]
MIDISIVFSSGIVTYFLLNGLRLKFVPINYIILTNIIYFTINTFFFWLFRTYSGIIRHSSYTDAVKLFFSQFSTFITIIGINICLLLFDYQKLCLTTGAFINAVFSFSLLFFYRIIVKQLFAIFFFDSGCSKRVRAIVYGSDSNAIAVANALKFEVPGRFELVGFIDKNNENSTKRILDLPIIKIKKSITVLMRYMKVEAIIMADETLNKEEKALIVNECIDYGFKAYTIPVILDVNDKKQISSGIKSYEIHDLLERKPIVLDTMSLSKKLKGKTILVTGAAGSIGSEIVRQILFFNPEEIILLDQAETPLNNLSLEILSHNKQVKIVNYMGDIRDIETVESIFIKYRPNVVYHAAAYKHVPMMENNPAQAIFTNVLGTKNIADLSQKYRVERFVMISTDKAVNPSSVMGASKRIAEMYVQSKHFMLKESNSNQYTKFITTRFGNVLGSNGSVVPLFARQIDEGGPITITHPEIIRYFMTIPEACQLVLEACSMGNGGEIYVFDMGKPVKIIDLAKKMIRLAGYIPEKEIKIKTVGLRPGEKLYEELLHNSAQNLPTHHEKIMVAIEVCNKHDVIERQVSDLIQSAKYFKNEEIVILMKQIVPEFKSLNSVYAVLNKKEVNSKMEKTVKLTTSFQSKLTIDFGAN